MTHVWGIGLTRTGTTSLSEALNMLGIKTFHWPTIHQLLNLEFEAATDETVSVVYKYLDAKYPGSKFIWTDREIESWLVSVERHRKNFYGELVENLNEGMNFPQWENQNIDSPTKLVEIDEGLQYASRFRERSMDMLFTQQALYETLMFNKEKFKEGYLRFKTDMERYFKDRPQDLLSIDVCAGEGWEKLCPFLDMSIPKEKFPHSNRGRLGKASS